MPGELTSADDGTLLTVEAGETVALRLPDNPSTGYAWEVRADPALVEVVDLGYRPVSTLVGGGGETRWSITARAPGTARIRLARRRPWEGPHSAVERFEFTLRISA